MDGNYDEISLVYVKCVDEWRQLRLIGQQVTHSLKQLAGEIQREEERFRICDLVYRVTQITGRGLGMAGFAFKLIAIGTSLPLLIAGSAVGISVAVASFVHRIVKEKKINTRVDAARQSLALFKERWEEFKKTLDSLQHQIKECEQLGRTAIEEHLSQERILSIVFENLLSTSGCAFDVKDLVQFSMALDLLNNGGADQIVYEILNTGFLHSLQVLSPLVAVIGILFDVKGIADSSIKIHHERLHGKAEELYQIANKLDGVLGNI